MPSRTFGFWILIFVLVASSVVPRRAAGAQAEVSDVFLFIDDYTNDSIVDAWAALNFTDVPIPPPNQVDDVLFEWFAPNRTMVFQRTVDPNDAAWALSSYRVDVMGTWTVNVTYTTNTSVHESLSFGVVPNIWGQGPVTLNYTTVVGRAGELRILPGTQVRFPSGGALRIQGKITAVGTPSLPIIFTSATPTPAPGDWNVTSFLETADNSSRISHAEVRYSSKGIRVMGVSPRIDNVTFSNNEVMNLLLMYSSSDVSDITVIGGSYGLNVVGSDADISRVTVTGSSFGALFQGMGGRARDFKAISCTQIGVYAYNASVSTLDLELTDNTVGMRADNSTFIAENLSIKRGQIGVQTTAGSNVLLVNSTMTDVSTLHYSAYGSSQIVARNVQLSPAGAIDRELQDDSTLVVQNFLSVLVRSYDTGAVLSGAQVDVTDNSTLIATPSSRGDGIAGPILVTHGIYNHTLFRQNRVVVVVRLSGYSFADNNRTVNMATSHIETFNGSIYDNDHDGMPDFDDSDDDNDDLSDLVEQELGTDPRRADTDNDGMPDGYEFYNDFDPLDPSDGLGDPDGDRLTNSDEHERGTDPKNPDSDGDGMPDGWEVGFGFDPLNGSDANQDTDGDGYTNLEEYRKGTNPRNAESKPPPPIDLGFLGTGDYWPILLLPLASLGFMVLLVVLAFLTATPRRRRRRAWEPEEPKGDDQANS